MIYERPGFKMRIIDADFVDQRPESWRVGCVLIKTRKIRTAIDERQRRSEVQSNQCVDRQIVAKVCQHIQPAPPRVAFEKCRCTAGAVRNR